VPLEEYKTHSLVVPISLSVRRQNKALGEAEHQESESDELKLGHFDGS
jgi:hypothetical protein